MFVGGREGYRVMVNTINICLLLLLVMALQAYVRRAWKCAKRRALEMCQVTLNVYHVPYYYYISHYHSPLPHTLQHEDRRNFSFSAESEFH